MKYVVEVGGNSWVVDGLNGDPGRTCVLDNATLYSKVDAMLKMFEVMTDYPNREYDIRGVEITPNKLTESEIATINKIFGSFTTASNL